jgi:hypothetical protein
MKITHLSTPIDIFDDLKRMTEGAKRAQSGAQQQITGGERDEDDAVGHGLAHFVADRESPLQHGMRFRPLALGDGLLHALALFGHGARVAFKPRFLSAPSQPCPPANNATNPRHDSKRQEDQDGPLQMRHKFIPYAEFV